MSEPEVSIRIIVDRRKRSWWERLRSGRPWVTHEETGLAITKGTFHFEDGKWEYLPPPRKPIEFDQPYVIGPLEAQ